MLGCFGTGRKLVMMDKWDAEQSLQLIEEHSVSHFLGVPTQSFEILRHPKRESYNLTSLIELAGGGSARPAEHVGAIQSAFDHATPRIGYGLTETNALGAINGGPSYVVKPGSTGPVTGPVMELEVHAEDSDTPLATGEVGRVCFRGPSIMIGYFNREDDTAKAISPGGWFDSGDLGYLDEDGFLFLVDRAKDIIVRGGENISCLEVEACIHAHPQVRDVTVFGLPDERLGEVVTAMVYLRPDGQGASARIFRLTPGKRWRGTKCPLRSCSQTRPCPAVQRRRSIKRRFERRFWPSGLSLLYRLGNARIACALARVSEHSKQTTTGTVFLANTTPAGSTIGQQTARRHSSADFRTHGA